MLLERDERTGTLHAEMAERGGNLRGRLHTRKHATGEMVRLQRALEFVERQVRTRYSFEQHLGLNAPPLFTQPLADGHERRL